VDLTPLYDVSNRTETKDGESGTVTLHVHVAPGAGRSSVVGRHGNALKLRVAAPPVGGRANDAASTLLAEAFDLKPKQVAIVNGESSRSKKFELAGVDLEDFERRLQLLVASEGQAGPNGARRG